MSSPSSIQRCDSNSRPLNLELSPITPGPGLPPSVLFFSVKKYFGGANDGGFSGAENGPKRPKRERIISVVISLKKVI